MAAVTLRDARKAVYDRWIALWPPLYPAVPYYFDNENASPGAGPWARVAVRETASIQETLGASGNRKFERKAIALVQLFAPRDTGVGTISDLAQAARGIYEGVSFNGIDVYEVTPREVPTQDRWFQVTVEVLFNYYETK